MFFVYLLSGLFLGWSLGANDAANVYGTAVGTRMLRFRTAAVTASVFILLGAVFGGAGAAHTLANVGKARKGNFDDHYRRISLFGELTPTVEREKRGLNKAHPTPPGPGHPDASDALRQGLR